MCIQKFPPLFMYTNEPVKLILKSQSAPRFTRSRRLIFCSVFVSHVSDEDWFSFPSDYRLFFMSMRMFR